MSVSKSKQMAAPELAQLDNVRRMCYNRLMTNPTKVYEVATADSPSAATVQVHRIEASSERAAYRKAAAELAEGAVVRSVVEVEE